MSPRGRRETSRVGLRYCEELEVIASWEEVDDEKWPGGVKFVVTWPVIPNNEHQHPEPWAMSSNMVAAFVKGVKRGRHAGLAQARAERAAANEPVEVAP